MRTRVVIAAVGVLLGLFGVFRLLTQVPGESLLELLVWLVAAAVLHDGVIAPVVVGVGSVIARVVPPRGRRYLQSALIAGALVTVVAVPLIDRQGSGPVSKALLQQNYTVNLLIALGIVAAVAVVAYLVALLRQRVSATKVRPDDVHDSSN